MLTASLFFFAIQGAPGTLADEARTALIDARVRVAVMEACDGGPGRNPPGALLRQRYDTLCAEAGAVLPFIDSSVGEVPSRIRCRRGRAGEDGRLAGAAVDRFAAALARRRAAMRGLWFGPLHLCRGTVLSALAARDEQDRKTIIIHFSPAMAEAVRAETTSRVRTPLPILLDGRTITAPIVNEPIAGGLVSIAGGDEPLEGFTGGAEALEAAAARPCDD